MKITFYFLAALILIGAILGASAFLALLFWVLGEEPEENEINNN